MRHFTAFISDLHLSVHTPVTTKLFLDFLNSVGQKADALYILGDFFEYWIGDDEHSPWITSIKAALKEAANTTPIYILPGNRDFLLGEHFAAESGTSLISDPSLIHCYGKMLLLKHGDDLCIQDTSHIRFRKFMQHPITKRCFVSLPLSWRTAIAKKLRKKKRTSFLFKTSSRPTSPEHSFDLHPKACEAILADYRPDYFIHGHTHLPKVRDVRITLGDWHTEGNALLLYDDGQFECWGNWS